MAPAGDPSGPFRAKPPNPGLHRPGAPGFGFPRRGRGFMLVGGRPGRAAPVWGPAGEALYVMPQH